MVKNRLLPLEDRVLWVTAERDTFEVDRDAFHGYGFRSTPGLSHVAENSYERKVYISRMNILAVEDVQFGDRTTHPCPSERAPTHFAINRHKKVQRESWKTS